MASASFPILSRTAIAATISDYLGVDEDDAISKEALVQHQLMTVGHDTLPAYLDCAQRSNEHNQKITEAFASVKKAAGQWFYNGEVRYNLCGIDEANALLTMIRQATKDRKVFYVLDIGGGNFQFANSLAEFINKQTDLPNDITVHIISVRGEDYSEETTTTSGKCKLHSFGDFKVEDLKAELEKRGLFLNGLIDLVTSRWCLVHLVDPVGTFIQAYNLLRPETGLFFGNGFNFFYQEENQPDWSSLSCVLMRKINVMRLLLDTKAPVLVQMTNDTIDEFILRRLDDFPCPLEMAYGDLELRNNRHSASSATVCKFKRTPQTYDKRYKLNLPEFTNPLFGSKSLFNWLQSNKLAHHTRTWKPLLEPLEGKESESANKA